MKISENVHQIRIDFHVTEEIRRFVYVYLILGKDGCFLVDTGVRGCEGQIEAYMETLGRKLSQIRAILLTHAHPDHIGGAAAIKERTGCRVYAPEGERQWMEHIRQQYAERPIPNFYTLVQESVSVDCPVRDGDILELEPGLAVTCISSAGHSKGDMSYLLRSETLQGDTLFTGDSIPAPDDAPILTDYGKSLASLEKLRQLFSLRTACKCCPAWHRACDAAEALEWIKGEGSMLSRLLQVVGSGKKQGIDLLTPSGLEWIGEGMGWTFKCLVKYFVA